MAAWSFKGALNVLACYLDESGDTGTLPTATAPIQPLICILGLSLPLPYLRPFTLEFLDLKARFFPGLFTGTLKLSRILTEIKGADIRAAFRTNDHARRHLHIGFLDALLHVVESYDCRIFGRVWIKPIGVKLDGVAVYTYSAQSIRSMIFFSLRTTSESLSQIPVITGRIAAFLSASLLKNSAQPVIHARAL